MAEELTNQLKKLASSISRGDGKSTIYGAINEIEYLRAEINKAMISGHNLLKYIDDKCACRRDWICHRCEAINSWEAVRGNR